MLSLKTYVNDLIMQRSLTNSTLSLDKTIERLSTDYKVNHGRDNAADYSIIAELKLNSGLLRIRSQ